MHKGIRFFWIGFFVCFFIFSLVYKYRTEVKSYVNYASAYFVTTDDTKVELPDEVKKADFDLKSSYFPLETNIFDLTVFGFTKKYGDINVINDEAIIAIDSTGLAIVLNGANLTEIDRFSLYEALKSNNKSIGDYKKIYRIVADCDASAVYATLMLEQASNDIHFAVISFPFDCGLYKFKKEVAPQILYISDEKINFETNGTPPSGGGALVKNGDDLYFAIGYSTGVVNAKQIYNLDAMSKTTDRGKTFKINLKSFELSLFTVGHRNMQDATLFEKQIIGVEHGPQGGDELNELIEGYNYGWPKYTYGTMYGSFDWHTSFIDSEVIEINNNEPIFSFVPSVAISSIFNTRNTFLKDKYDLLLGTLKSQSIIALKLHDGRVLFAEKRYLGSRVRAIDAIGEQILLLTDEGQIVFITQNKILQVAASAPNTTRYMQESLQSCFRCHSMEAGVNGMGPSLYSLYNRKIASVPSFQYSDALTAVGGKWTAESLRKYLRDPNNFAEGTFMPNQNLDEARINEIVKVLSK